jgi:hypothetical protein
MSWTMHASGGNWSILDQRQPRLPGGRPGPAVAPADPTSREEAANAEVI